MVNWSSLPVSDICMRLRRSRDSESANLIESSEIIRSGTGPLTSAHFEGARSSEFPSKFMSPIGHKFSYFLCRYSRLEINEKLKERFVE